MPDWDLKRSNRELDAERKEHTLTYTDPETKLVVRCVGVEWKNYPTIEWTVYFKNEGNSNSPILESIPSLDATFDRGHAGEFVLHHQHGDGIEVSFELLETTLEPNLSREFVPVGGRPTNKVWPYYNLELPGQREGMIVVIGWPGQWKSRFERDGDVGLRVVGGQELTHLTLRPGEEIRTPLILLQFYQGDWLRAQNVWRQWMLNHNFPKDHGKPLAPKSGAAAVAFFGFRCTQQGDTEFVTLYDEKDLDLDYWWMDFGWADLLPTGHCNRWVADKKRFPGGLKAVTDVCHKRGIETIVWFEFEHASVDSWLHRKHPDWLLSKPDHVDDGTINQGMPIRNRYRLNLGHPEAYQWVVEHLDKMITEEGIDWYRIDFNLEPLVFWRGNDAENRQGMTEIRYVEGFLGYLDEIRRRHPGMLMDSCASGGRRDDLETMRRAVPLLPSDVENNPEAYQCHTHGLSLWLPFFDSTHSERWDNYYFRSCIAPFFQRNWDVRRENFPVTRARECMKEWREVASYYFGDFWPLTEFGTGNEEWVAWQFDQPDRSSGVIQAFRRSDCPIVALDHKLHGLDADSHYAISDMDGQQSWPVMTGHELMERGLEIRIGERPGAVSITYSKAAK